MIEAVSQDAGAALATETPLLEVADGVWMQRPIPGLRFYVAIYATCAIGYLIGLALALATIRSDNSPLQIIGLSTVLIGLAIVFAMLAARMPRLGLRLDRSGAVLRGKLFTKQIRLTDIDGFVPVVFSPGLVITTVGVLLKRRDRSDQLVHAMKSLSRSDKAAVEANRARWQSVCEELDALLRELKGERVIGEVSHLGARDGGESGCG